VYLAGGGPEVERIGSEIASLTAAQQYMGRQLLASEFRSFDVQSPTLAVVTARETWRDTLYVLGQFGPEYGDEAAGERGPYSLDATYTLKRLDLGEGQAPVWQVSGVVYEQEPPEFE
jgi:hypothetical protein